MKRFNFGIFAISIIVFFILTCSSFVAAFARDEGTLQKDNKIIWSGITETFEPNGIRKMTNEISRVVYRQMVAEGFIRKD